MELILLAILFSYNFVIEDFLGFEQEWRLWVVDKINKDFCTVASNTTIGCTTHKYNVIQVLHGESHHQSIPGYDVYAHEITHARCDKYHPTFNWHIQNDPAIYFTGVNYWETCGIKEIGENLDVIFKNIDILSR